MKIRTQFLLVAIVGLAFVLRVTALDKYPTGFTPDEAAQGFTAYSILHTGHDEWGKYLPLDLRSFGDFKLPLYTYLTIPSIAMLGLNEVAVRLPSALFGTLAVLFTYLLAKKLSNDTRVGLFAAFLLTISPWHLPLSRGAFEANLTTSLLTGGLYLLLEGLENAIYLWPASILLGLNLFSYHSARLVTPVIIVVALFLNRRMLKRSKYLSYVAPLIIIALFLLTAGYTMLAGSSSRASDIAIFHPTDKWAAVSNRRFDAVSSGFPDAIEKIFTNKPVYIASTFTKNYLSYFSIDYLFTDGAGEGTYGMVPGLGVLYLFEVITVGFALYILLRFISHSGEIQESSVTREGFWSNQKDTMQNALLFLLLWVFVAAVPAAIAKGFHAANRDAVAMPAWQIISAIGLVGVIDVINRKFPKRQMLFVILSVVIPIVFFTFFLESYTQHLPHDEAKSMLYGWRQAVSYIHANQDRYTKIVVSRKLSEPQAYISFYLPLDPTVFQQAAPSLLAYEREGKPFLDQLGDYQIGKFEFMEIPQGLVPQAGVLYIGTPEEIGQQKNKIFQITYPNKQSAFLFVAK